MTTASPRAKLPSTWMTPAGSKLLPLRNAATAPASIVRTPLGSREPAIHFFRAVIGLAGVTNQVQRTPLAIASSGCAMRPDAMTICVPACVAILAASILVCMPPRESSEPAAPAIASMPGVMYSTSGTNFALAFSAGGQPVVVAVTDLVGRNGIVLVDHRHGPPLEQFVYGRARIEIASALLGVLQREQELPRRDAFPAEHLRPRARQRDLAHSGGGLAVLELQRSGRQLEYGAPERDRSRGDYEHVALASMQLGDVSRERGEPSVVQASAVA